MSGIRWSFLFPLLLFTTYGPDTFFFPISLHLTFSLNYMVTLYLSPYNSLNNSLSLTLSAIKCSTFCSGFKGGSTRVTLHQGRHAVLMTTCITQRWHHRRRLLLMLEVLGTVPFLCTPFAFQVLCTKPLQSPIQTRFAQWAARPGPGIFTSDIDRVWRDKCMLSRLGQIQSRWACFVYTFRDLP